jgi:amino acid permease
MVTNPPMHHEKTERPLAARAEDLLNHIETRVVRHAARSRHGLHHFISEHAARQDRHAILQARARGERSPIRPSIQDMERFAPEWARFIPRDPTIRAAVAHRLGQEYVFSQAAVPHLRAALGLDDEAVNQSYSELYSQPLQQIFATRLATIHHLRWSWAGLAHRLESLPPFWTAYALTLTETVGATILALPIAVAGIGPLPGAVLLIILGFVNMLTIGFMSEAVARSGAIRYGTGFIGQVVSDYLGSLGSLILTLALGSICILVLLAYYLGFSSALESALHIPAPFWAALLFLIALYFLRRESLNATIATALVVGAVNLSILVALSLLAFTHLRPAYLLQMNLPFVGGRPFDSSVLGLIFGVILTAYFGHLSVSNCGRVVLRRDPSGRSLIWGNIAAQGTAMVFYTVFVLAVAGAVAPLQLSAQRGTSLEPLAVQVGPTAGVLGSIYVILGIGMASIHFSLGLFNLVRERLPVPPQATGPHSKATADDSNASTGARPLPRRLESLLLNGRGRFLIEISPVIFIFALAEWSIFTHALSFTSLLGFVGIIVVSLLAGVFPVLLITASRRKGEYAPRVVYGILGHPLLLAAIYILFLASLLVHGLVIWQDPLQRGIALFTGIAIVGWTFNEIRHGLFTPRIVVELREDQNAGKAGGLSLIAGGRPTNANIQLCYPDREEFQPTVGGQIPVHSSLSSVSLKLPATGKEELKVWAHRVSAEGDSEAIPAGMTLQCTGDAKHFDLGRSNGEIVLPIRGEDCSLTINLSRRAAGG